MPNLALPFIVITDASKECLVAILAQNYYGTEHVVCYGSRGTSPFEKNYNSYELGILAFIFALKQWRKYLLGNKLRIITNNKALTYIKNNKKLNARSPDVRCIWKSSNLI